MAVWMVTGGSGFLGGHVLDALRSRPPVGAEVLALGRRCPAGWPERDFVPADLELPMSLRRAVDERQPDVVIHSAGRTPPGDPGDYYRVNTQGVIHLLDALRASRRQVRVVLAGSAAELGPVPENVLPVGEDYPPSPSEPYGLSKLLATRAGLAARSPLEVVATRVFNPIGPGQPLTQAFGRFAAWLADPANEGQPLVVGDLDGRRDFIDIRDVASALVALGDCGQPGRLYHIGTGVSHRVGDGLAHLIERCGRSVKVQVDPSRIGPAGPRDSRADVRRITTETTWRPSIGFTQSLDDLWNEVKAGRRLPLTA